jgi:hypothetical protein
MAANQKIELTAQGLVERLNMRFTALSNAAVAAAAYDANGDKYVTVIAGAGNNSVKAIIKFETAPVALSGATDGLGLAQRVYSPHTAKVLFEVNAAAAISRLQEFIVLGEVFRIGMKGEFYTKDGAAGVVAVTDITSEGGTNFVGSFQSLEWGGLASV